VAAADGTRELLDLETGQARPLRGVAASDQIDGWSRDGRRLWVKRTGYTLPLEIDTVEIATGEARPWRTISPQDRAGRITLADCLVTPDGLAHACNLGLEVSELYLVDGLR